MPTRKKYSYKPVTNEEALLFCKTCRDFLTDFSKGMDVNVEDYLTPDKSLRNLTWGGARNLDLKVQAL